MHMMCSSAYKGRLIIGIDIGEVNLGVAVVVPHAYGDAIRMLGVVNLRKCIPDRKAPPTKSLTADEAGEAIENLVHRDPVFSNLVAQCEQVVIEQQPMMEGTRRGGYMRGGYLYKNNMIQMALRMTVGTSRAIILSSAVPKNSFPKVFARDENDGERPNEDSHAYNKRKVLTAPQKLGWCHEEMDLVNAIPRSRQDHALDAAIIALAAIKAARERGKVYAPLPK
jgi:hypothetical protein